MSKEVYLMMSRKYMGNDFKGDGFSDAGGMQTTTEQKLQRCI